MDSDNQSKYLVAVIGAGPAGLYAANKLCNAGAHVVMFNRDVKPGGLAEYGIYPTKLKMKDGLRRQFTQILECSDIDYVGNLTIGERGDITLDELKDLGFQAILVTVGAQGTKWLGLPGEDLLGVYHAKDLVYHYNRLPPFCEQEFYVGRKVALIGVGNVMLDIARWAVRELKVDEVVAVARRGPAEVKFTKKEMESVASNLDLAALQAEIERTAPVMRAVGQDVDAARDFILSAMPKAEPPVSDTRFRFEFLASPVSILGDDEGKVNGLEVEDNTLLPAEGEPRAKGLGTRRILDVDTVIFCIGDRVDEFFGLPVRKNAFVKNPSPRFPVDGLSFEAYDPDQDKPVERVFVAGWSREASNGLVGIARKDGENGSQAVRRFLQTEKPHADVFQPLAAMEKRLAACHKSFVRKPHLQKLADIERCEAMRLKVEEFKFCTNQEMLEALGLSDN